MNAEPRVGVVVAVYDGVDPHHLSACLEGLVTQSSAPDEVWVVMDGPLTPELEGVVASFESSLPLRIERLGVRCGAGPARQAAIRKASTDFLAVADADDISLAHRLASQRRTMVDEGLDLVGSSMIEFGTATRGHQIREAPTTQAAIERRLRINNPFNHPTVMLRLSLARLAGGYRDLPFLEDYDLVARMIAAGARTANSPEPLVRYRLDHVTLRRRSGWRVVRSEYTLQRELVAKGLISHRRALVNLLVRNGYRATPLVVQRLVNRRLLSRNRSGHGLE